MILLFPGPDAVHLALTSGLVPAEVTLAPAAVSTDDQGRLYVEPSVALSKTTGKVLDRLGVKGSKRHGSEAVREVGSWVELVPLAKEPGTPEVAAGAAVLFELPSADDLPAIVTEMLRLGNDRQGFRWFAGPGDAAAGRVLLRVVGPPYYTLLRALDRQAGGVRAYLERAPRVWVELGWTHPLAAQVKVAEGQFALLTPPDRWLFLADAPFRDVYDLTQFPLPAAPVAWEAAEAPGPVSVPLRLTAGNAADAAELWVLRDDPVGQLDALVRDADERLTQRLLFAVAQAADGTPVAVLRTRPSKLPPPALPLENATAFKPYWKLPNLFLPVGRRLHPTLRRDAVRRLLADDPDRVVWLAPTGPSGFTPESVPDGAFRSLDDWVDYVIEAEQAPLAAWVGATRFDFDHFVCPDGGPAKPRPDKPDREPKAKDDAPPAPAKPDAAKPKPTRVKPAKADAAEYVPPPAEAVAPNEWKLRAKELEERFLAVEGPLDAPERVALWPQLAEAYTHAGDAATDAAVCWLNALWTHENPPAEWEQAWARAEWPQLTGRPVGAAELDAKLKASTTSVADARAVAAGFLAASDRPVAGWLPARLPAVQKYLELHEQLLPVRAGWLTTLRHARLAGGDPLGLARSRDRLLERLLTEGLRIERDLPGFLRYAGHRDADRLRAVRDRVSELHGAARAWVTGQAASTSNRPPSEGERLRRNLPYIDLMFSFAFAQLGEADTARELLASTRTALVRGMRVATNIGQYDDVVADISDQFLYQAFSYRVEQALAGKPHVGGLPPTVRVDLDTIRRKGQQAENVVQGPGQKNNPFWQAEYVIERMQKEFRLLEPNEIPGTYTSASKFDKGFDTDLSNLPRVAEPAKLANEIRRLYREGHPGRDPKDTQTRVVHKALSLSHRVGETFTLEVLGWVPGTLVPKPIRVGYPPTPKDVSTLRGELVERAIVLAAHYGRMDVVKLTARRFAELLQHEPDPTLFALINAAAGRLLRNLRKLGLRDEIDFLLSQAAAAIFRGDGLASVRGRYAASKAPRWAEVLVTLSNLAAGWLSFGMKDRAAPILELMKGELLRPTETDLLPQEYTAVACGYVRALGNGGAEEGLRAIVQLLREMPPGRIANQLTTAPFYSRFHLNIVEEVVWALVSDEFALGATGKKWLDDDEYLVRTRVHADLKRERERAGV